jgi:hypothetical protein
LYTVHERNLIDRCERATTAKTLRTRTTATAAWRERRNRVVYEGPGVRASLAAVLFYIRFQLVAYISVGRTPPATSEK